MLVLELGVGGRSILLFSAVKRLPDILYRNLFVRRRFVPKAFLILTIYTGSLFTEENNRKSDRRAATCNKLCLLSQSYRLCSHQTSTVDES